MFKNSAKEIKSIHCIIICAMLIALYAVLEMYSLQIIYETKVNFGFAPLAAIGMLFGPVVSTVAGGLCDIVGVLSNPKGGAFNPVFTLVGMLQGFIYGFVLYHKNNKRSILLANNEKKTNTDITVYIRVFFARLLDVIIVNIGINIPLIILMIGIKDKTAFITARLIKQAVEFPVDILVLFIVMPVILYTYKKIFKEGR